MATGLPPGLPIKYLDAYELKEKLGEGRFGTVREAIHKQSHDTVAIKKLEKNDHLNAELIPKDLNHENVIRLECLCVERRENATPRYLVMELCDRSLMDHMESIDGVLPEEVQDQLRLDVMSGLAYLHSKRIVHRDIKPNNILLCFSASNMPVAKLADFGLAKVREMAQSLMDTKTGNPFWMAPELFDLSCRYRDKIDIWSSGKVFLYVAIDKANRDKISYHACGKWQEHAGIELFGAALDSRLKKLIRWMMKLDPNNRPTSAAVLMELNRCASEPRMSLSVAPEVSATLSGTPLTEDKAATKWPPLTIGGGMTIGEQVTANRGIFHLLADGQWEPNEAELTTIAPVMCQTRRSFLAVGGSMGDGTMTGETLLYDVRRDKKDREFRDMRLARRHFGLVECGNAVYAVGGVDESNRVLRDMEILSMSTKRWKTAEPCPFPNAFPIMAAGEGLVYVIENTCAFNLNRLGSQRHISMATFDTRTKKWLSTLFLPAYIQSTSGASSVFKNGGLYVVGGKEQLCERYDCSENTWESLPQPKYPHSFGDCLVYENTLLLCGGFDSNDSIEQFDILRKKWQTWDVGMPRSLSYHFAMI